MNTAKSVLRTLASLAVVLAATSGVNAQEEDSTMEQQVFYRTVTVDGLSIFYREAGRKDARPFFCCTVFRPRRGCFSRY